MAKKASKENPPVTVDGPEAVETQAATATKAPRRKKAPVIDEPATAATPRAEEIHAASQDARPIDIDAVRARAYALFLKEGGPAFDNWIRAEREFRTEQKHA